MDILNTYAQPLLLSLGAAATGAYGNHKLQFENRKIPLSIVAMISTIVSILGLFLVYPGYGLEGLVGFSALGGAGGLFIYYMINLF